MTPKPSFRPAVASDAEAIGQLVRAAYSKWIPVIGREPKPMTVDYGLAVEQNDFELLFDQGDLVGLVETIRKDDCLWIENVAVSPDQQGRGFGRRLLARAEELAHAAHAGEMRLLTNADFQSNVTLYQRVGYRVTHTEPFMGGTTVYMTKRLGQPASISVTLTLKQLAGDYCIARLKNDAPIPGWADGSGFVSISRTEDELSIVCLRDRVPHGTQLDAGWTAFKFVGPFAFDQTGIVLSVVQPLSANSIGVFVVSTFDGDHLLLKNGDLDRAGIILRGAGHRLA